MKGKDKAEIPFRGNACCLSAGRRGHPVWTAALRLPLGSLTTRADLLRGLRFPNLKP